MSFIRTATLLWALSLAGWARADVVINEVFYNAPADLDDLQFIELHNTAAEAVDLAGWKLTRGVKYEFPRGTKIEAGGFLVLCKSRDRFKRHYGFDAAGQFEGSLSHSGERLELADARGRKVDALKYGSRAPWPVAPDGHGPSLERICPTSPGDAPENWAGSTLPDGPPRPGGTPGKKNSAHAPRLPPVISGVKFTPAHPAPDTEVTVEAEVRSPEGLREVELRYRVAGSNFEKEEATLRMVHKAGDRYAATIPGQKAGQILRFRVRASDQKGTSRYAPAESELRPAYSLYVHEKFRPGPVPFGLIVNVGTAEFRANQGGGGRGFAAPAPALPARGKSAYVHVSPKTGEVELFDFIQVTPRNAGRKVRFHKDRPLDGMTTINLIYEYHDRFSLAEPLAYEVYRKAGNAAPRTDFVRTGPDSHPPHKPEGITT